MTNTAYTPAYTQEGVACPVCREPIWVRLARGRKSGKPSVMLICRKDGRHFRGFINDQGFVRSFLERLDGGGV